MSAELKKFSDAELLAELLGRHQKGRSSMWDLGGFKVKAENDKAMVELIRTAERQGELRRRAEAPLPATIGAEPNFALLAMLLCRSSDVSEQSDVAAMQFLISGKLELGERNCRYTLKFHDVDDAMDVRTRYEELKSVGHTKFGSPVRETDELSEGCWRVGIEFNPSGDDAVSHIKTQAAHLIDFVLEAGKDPRCASIAATGFEDAAMWAVKSVTKRLKS